MTTRSVGEIDLLGSSMYLLYASSESNLSIVNMSSFCLLLDKVPDSKVTDSSSVLDLPSTRESTYSFVAASVSSVGPLRFLICWS